MNPKTIFLVATLSLASTSFAQTYAPVLTGTKPVLAGKCDSLQDAMNARIARSLDPIHNAVRADLWSSDDALLRLDLSGNKLTVSMGDIHVYACDFGWAQADAGGYLLEQTAVQTEVPLPVNFFVIAYRPMRSLPATGLPTPDDFLNFYQSLAQGSVDPHSRSAQVTFDAQALLLGQDRIRWQNHENISNVVAMVGPSYAYPQGIYFDLVWSAALNRYQVSNVHR